MKEQQARTPHRGIGGPFIVKGHMTNACAVHPKHAHPKLPKMAIERQE